MGGSWSMRNHRIKSRNVLPCTTSVNSVNPVASTVTSRCPASGRPGFSDTASASASVTAPRKPPQSITSLDARPTAGDRPSHANPSSSPNRITARAAKAATTTTPTSPTSAQVTPPSNRGTSNAARMNTNDPDQWASNSQVSRR